VWDEVRAEVRIEFAAIERLLSDHAELLDAVRLREPTIWERSALAAVLHAFYNGVENVLKRIAAKVDAHIPEGSDWHARLIEQFTAKRGDRSPLLDASQATTLKEYMRYRHFFRHSYTFDLNWAKMRPLVESLHSTFGQLREGIIRQMH
jgi:hypothetical protein